MKKWVKIKLGVMACMCSLSIQAAEIVFGKENFICAEIQHKIQEAPDFFHRMRQEGGKYILFDSPLKRKDIGYVSKYFFLGVFNEYWASKVTRKIYEQSLFQKNIYNKYRKFMHCQFLFCNNKKYANFYNKEVFLGKIEWYITIRYIENKNSFSYKTRIFLPDRPEIIAYAVGIVDSSYNFLQNNIGDIKVPEIYETSFRDEDYSDKLYSEIISHGAFAIIDEDNVFHPKLNHLKITEKIIGFNYGIPLGEAFFKGIPIDIFEETFKMNIELLEIDKIKLYIYQNKYPEDSHIISKKICEIIE